MKSKKIRSLFCAAALTLSLAACGSKTSDYSDQTITGEITEVSAGARSKKHHSGKGAQHHAHG